MKIVKKIILIVLCLSVLLTTFACGKNDNGTEQKWKDLDTVIYENGTSEYSIVVPKANQDIEDAKENPPPSQVDEVVVASRELQFFFKEATGIELPIITDDQVVNMDGKYFSLGNTSICKESKYEASNTVYGTDGFIIKTYRNSVIFLGGSDKGTMFSVYSYLKDAFDLEIYTVDCYTFDSPEKLCLRDYDIKEIPDIPYRVSGRVQSWYTNKVNKARLRTIDSEEVMTNLGHAFYHILPKYDTTTCGVKIKGHFSDHPEWYNNGEDPGISGNWQLCLTNNEMRQQFVENVKSIIKANKNINIIALGQNDGDGYCQCPNCEAKYEEYGKISGLYVEFSNYVSDEIDKWLANETDEELKSRRELLQYYNFAYGYTEEAPTKDNEPTIIANDNVGVMFAPIGNHSSHSYFDLMTNASSAGNFMDWQKVTNNMYLWGYTTHFADFMSPHNSFGSIKENVVKLKEVGAIYYFDQAACATEVPNFDRLREYLFTKLAWDSSLDYRDLVENFIYAYYGDVAGKYVLKYFDALTTHCTYLEGKYSAYSNCAGQLTTLASKTYFSLNVLTMFDNFFVDALDALDKNSNTENYEVYRNRVEYERLDVQYLLLDLYSDSITKSKYLSMIDAFQEVAERNGFNVIDEYATLTISTKIYEWKQNKK